MPPMPANTSSALDPAHQRIARLRERLGARLVETHISWVLLTATEAYKIKKPVRLPFLDFTTLAARRHFCEEELRLNGRLAPGLYLGLAEVRDGPDGPSFEGDGPVVETAVRMRRFPEDLLWSHLLSKRTLAPRHVDAMAVRLAAFHRDAPKARPDSDFGSTAMHRRVTGGLIKAVDAWTESHRVDIDWPALRRWLERQLHELEPLWAARQRDGRVRECHGDLHAANVLQLGEEAVAFDGVEFDGALRWIDVLDDVAFLAMDLLAYEQSALAFRFVNAWFEENGDYRGLPALRFYMVRRALVRWQVAAIREEEGVRQDAGIPSARYLALASALSLGADPRLAIMHGLPGSGKTSVSQAVLEAGCAMRVRSDVERKRLFGLSPLSSSRARGGIYHPAATARTYTLLFELARLALLAGWPVIVDAAFLRRSHRLKFAALATSFAVPFVIIHCVAPVAVLRRRIEERAARGSDASEADVSVLDRLKAHGDALDEAERTVTIEVQTDRSLDTARWVRRWKGEQIGSPVGPEPGFAAGLPRLDTAQRARPPAS
jgi:aminoglycoside phosphotransferase family enzyme/predicted kinase